MIRIGNGICKRGFSNLCRPVWVVALIVLLLAPVASAQNGMLAFPGAEGFGRFARGGRGGQICEVTNLNDAGPGSLRACIDSQGPRIVVFRVGGTIELQSSLILKNSNITIAGNTAPADGVQLKGAGLVTTASDVIIRYLRIRPGTGRVDPNNNDALSVRGGSDIIVDHSSFSWATDENTEIWAGPDNVTMSWNIISEGLVCAGHAECPHSMGMLIGWQPDARITIHHNLFAHNNARNPGIGNHSIDFVNNIIYNYGVAGVNIIPSDGPVKINFVGNRYIHGPDSDTKGIRIDGRREFGDQTELYVKGNIIPWYRPTDDLPEDKAIQRVFYDVPARFTRLDYPPVTTTDAFQATTDVLQGAGATLPGRDPVDTRIVNDVNNRTGRLINSPSEVGGWPNLSTVARPAGYDTDRDGMPNAWELQHGFNPNNPADGPLDADGDGWTNVEEFLNGTDPGRAKSSKLSPPMNLRGFVN